MRHKLLQHTIVAIVLFLCACNPPQPIVNELSSTTSTYDETIRINNCGNKAESTQIASRSFSVKISGTGMIKAGYEEIIEGGVSASYEQEKNTTKTQTLNAAPNTNMEFVLRWSDNVRSGNVTVNGESTDYTVRIPISVEQISSTDLGNCPSESTSCPYQGSTDTQTFINIIRAEEEAVLTKNINIIKNIYSPNATVRDASKGETSDVLTHYQGGFTAVTFVQLSHYDFDVIKNTGNKAWAKASDSGIFVFTDTNEQIEYTTDPGASHFIFEKNSSGCWLISQFTKLAAGEPFP